MTVTECVSSSLNSQHTHMHGSHPEATSDTLECLTQSHYTFIQYTYTTEIHTIAFANVLHNYILYNNITNMLNTVTFECLLGLQIPNKNILANLKHEPVEAHPCGNLIG